MKTMVRLSLFLFFFSYFLLDAHAQTLSRKYEQVPLSQVLTDINRVSTDYDIYFIFDELEKFPVTCQFNNLSVTEALRKVIGFYPVEMTISGQRIFLECFQRKNAIVRGRVVGQGTTPVPFASVVLSRSDSGEKLNTGITNQSGDFAVPCDSMAVTVRISCIGYNTFTGSFNAGNIGVVRLTPVTYDLKPIEVSQKRKGKRQVSKAYHIRARKIRKEIWEREDTCFETTIVPDSLLSFPEIIVAQSQEHSFKRKFIFRPWHLLASRTPNSFGTYRTSSISVDHRRVLLNDDHTVSKYAQLDYPLETLRAKDPNISIVMGIRVIKPDGRVREIETDEYTQPFRENESFRADYIPVEGLERGDLIDYFVWKEINTYDNNPEPSLITIDHGCPQMNNRVSVNVDKHLNVQYRIINQADTLQRKTDTASTTTLCAHYKDLKPRSQDERGYAVYVRDEGLRVNAPLSATGHGVKVNPSASEVLATRMKIYETIKEMSDKKAWNVKSWNETDTTIVSALVANLSQKTSSQELLAEALYHQALRFPLSLVFKKRTFDGCKDEIFLNREYTIMFAWMLRQADVPFQLAMTTMKGREGIDQLMDENNIVWMIRTHGGKCFIPVFDGSFPPDADSVDAKGISSRLIGQKARFMDGHDIFVISDNNDWK